jgi:hypothetical protein
LKEDELGRPGFSGRVAEPYRRNEPTGWTRLRGAINSSFESASFFLTPQGIHHGMSDEFSQLVRKNWKKYDCYDYKLMAVETERPLKITPEAKAAAREGSQINNTTSSATRSG